MLEVLRFPHPALKQVCGPAPEDVSALVDGLLETMASFPRCVGLAAPQVGVSHRLLVYRVEPDSPVQALVNPDVEWSSREQETMEEGCLSLPGVHVDVERPLHVRVTAQDATGERITVEASGLEARVIQHEIDHLDGVLILDRTTRDQRKQAMRALREAGEGSPPLSVGA